jgi:hypothetical protein
MKNIRFISIVLLVFTGVHALAGGYLLIEDPSGASLHIDIEQVDAVAFDDFLIPGIILFLLIGVMSILAAFFVVFRWNGYDGFVILQGVLLFTWIVVQIFLFEQIYYVQYIVAGIALLLVIFGLRLSRALSTNER